MSASLSLPSHQLCGLYASDNLLFREGLPSGIDSKQSQPLLQVSFFGVLHDAQADGKNHGGAERVLHHFPLEHYQVYQQQQLMASKRTAPAMGENISSLGITEHHLHIGDIVALGDVLLQVTQPRAPCFKLNVQFGHLGFSLAMQETAMCGWFYRVLQEGTIKLDDQLILRERHSDISLAESMALYFAPQYDAAAYEKLLTATGLASDWQQNLQQRLANGKIEDWQKRLHGPAQFQALQGR
ncbi:MOSC domain-containing protein [Shewanella sp. A32]|uniref:MOSC domain-containing protein n=1 Tax=Shewanella sp. A32 TaxID=3031327 RepID=UPI0023B8C578|nr:MOSC domain-containing protein [Shewanella sp. A32]MDF0533399.1 MOSC domain-containing protein [Shewanella sp. A32]